MTGPPVGRGVGSRDEWAIVLAALAVVLAVAARGWMGDDAFITLRTVDNFVAGHGLRWNVAERVQAYTHPLWLFVLALPYSITREPYLTTLAINLDIPVVWVGWTVGLARRLLWPFATRRDSRGVA